MFQGAMMGGLVGELTDGNVLEDMAIGAMVGGADRGDGNIVGDMMMGGAVGGIMGGNVGEGMLIGGAIGMT